MEEVPVSQQEYQRTATGYPQAIVALEDAKDRETKLHIELAMAREEIYDLMQRKDDELTEIQQSSALFSEASTEFGSRATICGDLSDNFDFRDADFEKDFEEEKVSQSGAESVENLKLQILELQTRCSNLVAQNSDYRLVLDELSTAHRAMLRDIGRQFCWKDGGSPGREKGPESKSTIASTFKSISHEPVHQSYQVSRTYNNHKRPGRKITQYVRELCEGNK